MWRRALPIVLVVAACLGGLAGCDAFYFFVAQNNTARWVTVSVLGKDVRIKPCGVRNFMSGGVAYGKPVHVRVTDEAGEIVYTTRITAEPRGKGNPFEIQIPAQPQDACPPSANAYMLRIWNHSDEEVQLWLENEQIGSVQAGTPKTFGPLPGTWRDAGNIVMRTPSGSERRISLISLGLDYELGQVPEITYAISSSR